MKARYLRDPSFDALVADVADLFITQASPFLRVLCADGRPFGFLLRREITGLLGREYGIYRARKTASWPAFRFLIDVTSPRNEAHALLGDLEEGFKKRARKQGRTYAHAWYASQALRSVGPLLWAAGKRVLGITAVSEFLKRIG